MAGGEPARSAPLDVSSSSSGFHGPGGWRQLSSIRAARNRHDGIIERANAVHLFSDNWPIRRWTSAWVAGQKTADPADGFFEELESISADDILCRLTISKVGANISGSAVRLGYLDRAAFDSPENLASSVRRLAAAYAEMDGFTVPYLEVTG